MSKHWTERLFVDRPSIFRSRLEAQLEEAEGEVEGLTHILSEHGVTDGGSVLDLACGIGRHSVALAERDFRVVGVDISPDYIARAEALADERGVRRNVEFLVGDMRLVAEQLEEREGTFDASLSLFTSLGYWDEDADREILEQLSHLSAPDGVLVIDIANRDWILRNFQARDFGNVGDDLLQMMERRLDLEESRMHNIWRYYGPRGRDLEHVETFEVNHRVYSLHELKALVESSGWRYQTCYGGFGMEPFTMDSRRIVLVAKRL